MYLSTYIAMYIIYTKGKSQEVLSPSVAALLYCEEGDHDHTWLCLARHPGTRLAFGL